MISSFYCFVLLCSSIFVEIDGWGPVGHTAVAELAHRRLTPSARQWIESLVPWHWNGNLSAMSSWADSILYSDSNPTGFNNWQWSRPHHFLNQPDGSCKYLFDRDCPQNQCIHGSINNYTQRLTDQFDFIQLQEALFFLIHHVGDIHQPLHAGYGSDFGGNSIRIYFLNSTFSTNLHSLWDSGLIGHRLRSDFQSDTIRYYEHIYQLMLKIPEHMAEKSIEEWIEENTKLICGSIYLNENNETMQRPKTFNLTEIYYQRHISTVEERLALGGLRLGNLLNRIARERSSLTTTSISTTTSTTQTSKCLAKWIFIIIFIVEILLAIFIIVLFFIRFNH